MILVPPSVTGLVVSRLDNSTMTANWSQVTYSEGYTIGYEVYYAPNSVQNKSYNTITTGSTAISISGLEAYLTYNVQVRARSIAGYGPYSAPVIAQGMSLQ